MEVVNASRGAPMSAEAVEAAKREGITTLDAVVF
jgi:hypothetical protein